MSDNRPKLRSHKQLLHGLIYQKCSRREIAYTNLLRLLISLRPVGRFHLPFLLFFARAKLRASLLLFLLLCLYFILCLLQFSFISLLHYIFGLFHAISFALWVLKFFLKSWILQLRALVCLAASIHNRLLSCNNIRVVLTITIQIRTYLSLVLIIFTGLALNLL